VSELIDIMFGAQSHVNPGNSIVDGNPDSPMGRGTFGGYVLAHCNFPMH